MFSPWQKKTMNGTTTATSVSNQKDKTATDAERAVQIALLDLGHGTILLIPSTSDDF